ncbi:Trichodiene synthase [Penicillium soppii]|uniref:Trichodiene synthase n=1 Tax=Penicillium soppii TaxID=69789 RepID=UPI002546FB6A|nr:Trichodiene synthase [Penicillium soppii]KAJ5876198.1 Trichodiene synthase [Penicillium soppii]
MDPIHAESNLSYHGLRTKSAGNNETGVIKGMPQTDQVKSVIRIFLEDIKFDSSSPFIKDHQMDVAVWHYFKGLNLGQKMEKSVQRTLKLSVTFTYQAYTALPLGIRVLCVIQFLYMFLVDELGNTPQKSQGFNVNGNSSIHLYIIYDSMAES